MWEMSFRIDISPKRTIGFPWSFSTCLYGSANKAIMLALTKTIPLATTQAAIGYTIDDRRQLSLHVNTFI